MNQKELRKTFYDISNWEHTLVFMIYAKKFNVARIIFYSFEGGIDNETSSLKWKKKYNLELFT